ncbi:MAG: NAD-dependent epimerase/dehydratase family protein [Cytophaga sp.]|nr:NAD-dependent epimerase/dehydratase family protein [Undibacterium sp.]
MKSKGTVPITGASGYIGKHLLAQLEQLGGVRIKVLSRRRGLEPGASEFGSGVEVVEGDLHRPDSLQAFLEPGCTVVHLAYLQGKNEIENLAATANLLDACKASGIQRIIHVSTAAVVGRVPDDIITEKTVCHPVSEYGITKLKIEKAILDAGASSFDVGILRPTAVFGPKGGSLKKLVSDLKAEKNLRNYLKSCFFNKRRMNLVSVANVVAGIIFMVKREENFNGEVFIVSEDDNPGNNFADVERFLMEQLELKSYQVPTVSIPLGVLSFLLKFLDKNDANPRCNFDSRKLLALGFTRPVEFEAGLKIYCDWYRSTGH